MKSELLIACAQRLSPLQPIILTFNRDGIVGISRLIGLTRSCPSVRIHPRDLITCMAVEQSQEWCHDRNRTVEVYHLGCGAPTLIGQIARDVEKVAVPDHGAKALFTTRTKTFEEAAAIIIREVVTDELKAEIESWGLSISWEPRMNLLDDLLPGIEFTIHDSHNKMLLSVILDGWSGRMALDGKWGEFLYVEPKQLQHIIRENFDVRIEQMTSAA